MENKVSVKKNFIFNVLYQVFLVLVPFITTPYVSRVLGAGPIGDYSYTASLVSYFTLIAGLGFANYGQREIAYVRTNENKRSHLFLNIFTFRVITTVLCLIAYFIFAFHYSNANLSKLLIIQSMTLISVLFDISFFFQALENFKIVLLRNFFVKLVGIVLIFIFVRSPADIYVYVAIMCATTLIGNISLWIYLPKYLCKVQINEIKPFNDAKQIFELFIPLVATQVYNVLDKTMIGVISKSSLENGYYEQTTKIINICMALVTALGPVLLPHMANAFANDDQEEFERIVKKAYHAEILMAVPICFGIVAISDSFVPWFFGSGFNKVKLLLKIYAFVLLIIPLSNVAGYAVLTPTKQQNKGTFAVCMGAITNFSLNSILIRQYASVGASVATIFAESVVTILHLFFIRKDVDVKSILMYLGRQIIVGALMLILILFISNALINIRITGVLLTIIQIIIGVLFYGFVCIFILKDSLVISIMENLKQRLAK